MRVSEYWKSIVGALSAGAAVLVTALDDNAITANEWLAAGLAALAALGVVAVVPNASKPQTRDLTDRSGYQ